MPRMVFGIWVRIGILLIASGLAGQQSNSFQGSVPSETSSTSVTLTLDGAIQRGLHFNLGLLESQEASRTVRAERIRALSVLLPQVVGSVGETVEQLNLKNVGIRVPPNPIFSIPSIAGPFSFTTAQASVSAKIFDWSARKSFQSAKAGEEAASLSVDESRDLVVEAVANAYLRVIADASRVDSIKAQVDTDQAVYNRAQDRRTAGVAAGIDVLRAQVQLKTQQQALLAQQNQFDKDKLALGRIIGFPPAQVFELADTAPFSPLSAITQEEAIHTAFAERPNYLSSKKRVEAAQRALDAAKAQWYPTVNLSGYYGDAGPTIGNSHGMFAVTGSLHFNIFDGGRIRSEVEKARATLKQRSDELANQGAQIEVEVRDAFLDLQSAAQQVSVARDNLALANETLEQARDRFDSGVTDNIEVVQAQGAVAGANDNLIAALYAHNLAKVALAKAMGTTAQRVRQFLTSGNSSR